MEYGGSDKYLPWSFATYFGGMGAFQVEYLVILMQGEPPWPPWLHPWRCPRHSARFQSQLQSSSAFQE